MNEPLIIPIDKDTWEGFARTILREVPNQRTETWKKRWQNDIASVITANVADLESATHIIIAPESYGHLLPWTALAFYANWKASVTTVPSYSVLDQTLKRPVKQKKGLLIVGNPTGDLPYADQEARQVAKLFDAEPLIGEKATKEVVLAQLEQVEIAHFAAHAYFDNESPFDSGILLANNTVLTARDLLSKNIEVPEFIVLSACQSGLSRSLGGEEMAGLSQALLYAGAKSLLVSMWKVQDEATAFMILHFYKGWKYQNLKKGDALRSAMEITMQVWQHTYYWGAFTLIGDQN